MEQETIKKPKYDANKRDVLAAKIKEFINSENAQNKYSKMDIKAALGMATAMEFFIDLDQQVNEIATRTAKYCKDSAADFEKLMRAGAVEVGLVDKLFNQALKGCVDEAFEILIKDRNVKALSQLLETLRKHGVKE